MLIATALSAELNQLSEPVIGENGVYIVNVDNVNTPENQFDNLYMTKSYIQRNYTTRAMRSTFQALIEMANIDDNRGNFY